MRQLDFNSRAVFVGKTGCGKTTLAERLYSQFEYVVLLDSKAELKSKGFKVCTKLDEVFRSKETKIIWQPNPHEQNLETYERFFKWIYDRKNTVCYIDELYAVCKNAQNIPFWLNALLTRGRSRGIGTFSATQKPTHVPDSILSQAEIYYVFQMRLESHREKIEGITGIPKDELQNLRDHEFYYADDSSYYPKKLKLRL